MAQSCSDGDGGKHIPYHDAPEVVPSTASEYSPSNDTPFLKKSPYDNHLSPEYRLSSTSPYADPQFTQKIACSPETNPSNEPKDFAAHGTQPDTAGLQIDSGASGKPPKWWRRKRTWLIAVIALIIIIGLAVGLGVGLAPSSDSNTADKSNNESSSKANVCDGPCPQTLSTAVFDDKLHIFARTASNRITYKFMNESKWDEEWTDLGKPDGTIISQPTAVAWEMEGVPRLDIFVVSSYEKTVYGRHLANDSWSDWRSFGPNAGSQPVLCQPYDGRIDLWSTDAKNNDISHNWWMVPVDPPKDKKSNPKWYTDKGSWQLARLGSAASAPGVVCRESSIIHDVAYYDKEEGHVWHHQWHKKKGWLNKQSFKGAFVGDPTLVTFPDAPERVDFFGLQDDDKLYHYSWTTDDGFSSLYDIGGSIASVPTVISLNKGTYEMLALDTNGTVMYQHYDGSEFADEWKDLGVKAQAAPLATRYDGKVYIFMVDTDGQMTVATLAEEGIDGTGNQAFEAKELGGEMSEEYYE